MTVLQSCYITWPQQKPSPWLWTTLLRQTIHIDEHKSKILRFILKTWGHLLTLAVISRQITSSFWLFNSCGCHMLFSDHRPTEPQTQTLSAARFRELSHSVHFESGFLNLRVYWIISCVSFSGTFSTGLFIFRPALFYFRVIKSESSSAAPFLWNRDRDEVKSGETET